MSSTIDGPDKVRVAIAVHVEGAGPVVEVQLVQGVLKRGLKPCTPSSASPSIHAIYPLGMGMEPVQISQSFTPSLLISMRELPFGQ